MPPAAPWPPAADPIPGCASASRHIGGRGLALLCCGSDPRYRSATGHLEVSRARAVGFVGFPHDIDLDGGSGCSRFWPAHRGALSRPPVRESAHGPGLRRGAWRLRGDSSHACTSTHLTIQLLRDIDSRALAHGFGGGFEHRQTLYLPVALRPAKTALTRYFASHKALVDFSVSRPVLTGPLANGLHNGERPKCLAPLAPLRIGSS